MRSFEQATSEYSEVLRVLVTGQLLDCAIQNQEYPKATPDSLSIAIAARHGPCPPENPGVHRACRLNALRYF